MVTKASINNLNFDSIPKLGKPLTVTEASSRKPKEGSGSRLAKHDQNVAKINARIESNILRQRQQTEARILQEVLPLWDDDNRGVPNPLIRSGLFSVKSTSNREFLDKMTISSLSNYTVQYTGRELQQDDLSVWMSLINLARSQPMSDSVFFTGYQLVKDLGWSMNTKSYKRAQDSIERLKVTGIEIKETTESRQSAYSGSLIREYSWTSEDNEGNIKWMVRFEPKVTLLFVNDSTTLVEWDMRKAIGPRAAVAQWLHTFYASHKEPGPISIERIYELCRSGDTLSSFRRSLRLALQRLKDKEFLTDYRIVGEQVYVQKKIKPKLVSAK